MKITVGIDHSQAAERAATLAARIGFRDPQLHMVTVVGGIETYGVASEIPPAPELVERLINEQIDGGRRRLAECSELVSAAVPTVDITTSIRRGHVANEIMEESRHEAADMIAVGSGTTAVEAMLLGSVSRKLLTSCPLSLLIAKERPLGPGPLRAVLATDHSPYSKRCIEAFIKMMPRGFGELTLVTAYPKQVVKVMQTVIEHFRADVDSWVEKNLEQENQRTAEQLQSLHCIIKTKVVSGPADEAIQAAAIEADADLIILGAQGHGFLDRLLTGSVSHRVAMATDRHVLILRVP